MLLCNAREDDAEDDDGEVDDRDAERKGAGMRLTWDQCYKNLIIFSTRAQQGCKIVLNTTYQKGKNIPDDHKVYQMTIKYTKWPQNIPNGCIIDHMAIK
jgi:hypothetical protein